MARRPMFVQGRLGVFRALEVKLEAGFLEAVLVPVDGLAGILGPNVIQLGVAVVVGVANHIVDDFVLVDFFARFLLQAAVERAQVVPDAAANGALLKAHDLGAFFRRRAGGKQARRTGAAHQDFGFDGFDNFVVGDFGRRSQPVCCCACRLFDGFGLACGAAGESRSSDCCGNRADFKEPATTH